MNELPSRANVLDNIKKLGFECVEEKTKEKSKKMNYSISLDHKKDQKVLMGLSYYSNNFMQNVVMDSNISKILSVQMIQGGKKSVKLEEII